MDVCKFRSCQLQCVHLGGHHLNCIGLQMLLGGIPYSLHSPAYSAVAEAVALRHSTGSLLGAKVEPCHAFSKSLSNPEKVVAVLPAWGGWGGIFTLSTNTKNLCICFCSTPAPLAIKIYSRKCKDNCLLYPCPISTITYFFYS